MRRFVVILRNNMEVEAKELRTIVNALGHPPIAPKKVNQ